MLMRKIDRATGLWLEDVVLDVRPLPEEESPDTLLIAAPCPDGLYRPRWDVERETWEEGATAEETAAIKAAGQATPTPAEQWRTDIENALVELADLIAGGE